MQTGKPDNIMVVAKCELRDLQLALLTVMLRAETFGLQNQYCAAAASTEGPGLLDLCFEGKSAMHIYTLY